MTKHSQPPQPEEVQIEAIVPRLIPLLNPNAQDREEAWEAFYMWLQNSYLVSFIVEEFNYTGPMLEDILQDVYIKLYKCIHLEQGAYQYEGVGAFINYTKTTIRYHIYNLNRREKKYDCYEDLENELFDGSVSRSPEQSLQDGLTREQVQLAVHKLPEKQQLVMQVYLQGYETPSEIARMLQLIEPGITANTVAQRMSRARQRLAKLLAKS